MRKITKVAAAVSSALLLTYGAAAQASIVFAAPAAYAESALYVTNFRVLDGAGASVLPLVGANPGITNLSAVVTSTMSASINGVSGVPVPGPSVSIDPLASGSPFITQTVAAGPGTYVPYVSYGVNTLGAGVFAGAASDHVGNGLGINGEPYTTATTQAQVNINSSNATGSADSRQQLGTDFSLTVTGGGFQTFQVLFDAESVFRIALGQAQIAAGASREWNIKVTPKGALGDLLDWSPQGNGSGLGGACTTLGVFACSVIADSFDLNFNATIQSIADLEQVNAKAAFGVMVSLAPGDYTISLSHKTGADARAQLLPEPGSLALLGLGLVGLIGMSRRAKKA